MVNAIKVTKALSRSSGFSYIVTPNIDHMARLNKQESSESELPTIYRNADLSLCDSRVLEKLLKIKGNNIAEVIPGSTLTELLFDDVLTPQDIVVIIGGDDYVIDRLSGRYPDLNLLHKNPSMGFINKDNEVDEIIDFIRQSGAHYVFLSVGSPRQEILAYRLKQASLTHGVGLCVGAAISFLVGDEKRAPMYVQKLHMEWAYRMLQDPRRLVKRYWSNFMSIGALYRRM